MTQDKAWMTMWRRIMDFMEANQRRPSKYYPEERLMHTWLKQNKKLLNAGRLKDSGGDCLYLGPKLYYRC